MTSQPVEAEARAAVMACDPDTAAVCRRAYLIAKRVLDVAVAALLLILLSPMLLLISAAIKFDCPGAVLFRQRRIGQSGCSFEMLKFRTMRPDRRVQISSETPPFGERRRVHKSARDPRVTRIGRILRRTGLDELPQLWNVVKGEMSLVGPRPELPEIVAQYESWQHARHAVLPGITGWWQVNRDGQRLMHQATEFDMYYIEHQSLSLDLLIMMRTVGVLLRGLGAY
jgi:lipopolysaccharide/colanic/teichoic acid biosynthesis glycosyltransferase